MLRHRPVFVLALVALGVSLAGFAWTLGGHFVGDDFGYVSRFFEYPFTRWPRLFVEGWAGDMWGFQLRELRPVTALAFMLDARVWGDNAWGFRLTNLLLHAAVATLVGVAAWRAAKHDLACGVGATVLFALHPVHAEPVQWITGRVDMLATLFYVAGLLVFLRYRTQGGRFGVGAITAVYAAGAFSKEFGLTLPLMFLAADLLWLETWRRWRDLKTWAPYLGCLAFVTVYFFCRRAAFGTDGVGAGWPDLTSVEFQRSFAQRQLIYFGHLFPPFGRWWYEGAPWLQQHVIRTFLFLAVGVVVGFVAWWWSGRHRWGEERRAAVFFGLGWYAVATLPLVVTYISPRHLYLASAGLCVAVALVLRGVLRSRGWFGLAVVALAALYTHRLSEAMKPWQVAATLSGEIAREVDALESVAQKGGAVFLDVPEIREGAYVWVWAVPFALRPPFTRGPLVDEMVVLESRGLYVDWERWHQQPAVAALRQVQVDSWVIQLFDGQPSRRIPVSAEKVRAAAERFAAEPLQKFPHESWRKLINELIAP